jgi:hypothetical protein
MEPDSKATREAKVRMDWFLRAALNECK